jgi:hypothetical protein
VLTKEDLKFQKQNKKLNRRSKRVKASNLDMLVSLGFDTEFVSENQRLGLKSRVVVDEVKEEEKNAPMLIPPGFGGRR